MSTRIHPFFHAFGDGSGGRRFCLLHEPASDEVRGAVVYAHPFAEEMNKSRRMAALGARALAAQGLAVLQIDLQGCGDSDGDFADASWASWVDDLCAGMAWLAARHPGPRWFWGLRAGALLASEAARRSTGDLGLLWWQPPLQGRQVLQQFLRLKCWGTAGEGVKTGADALRQALQGGAVVDVAGYALAPALALPMDGAGLLPLARGVTRLVWLETSARARPELLPASREAMACIDAGVAVTARAVTGPPFWQTAEVEEAPALIDATRVALGGGRSTGPAGPAVPP